MKKPKPENKKRKTTAKEGRRKNGEEIEHGKREKKVVGR